jgi:C4-dicarboxylate-specific signal transduction histidine kinase
MDQAKHNREIMVYVLQAIRNRFALHDKLIIIYSVILTICMTLGLITSYSLAQLNATIQKNVTESKVRSSVINTAISSVNNMESSLIRLIAYSDKKEIRQASIASIKASSLLDEAIQNLQHQIPENTAVLSLAHTLNQIKTKRMQLIKFGIKNNDDQAFKIIKEIAPQLEKVTQHLTTITLDDKKNFDDILNLLEHKLSQSLQSLGLIICTALALLFFINSRLGKAKDALKKLNTDLENKVLDRTSQLEASNAVTENTLKELKETQAHLVELEKMSSLSTLVAGVAHEINTPVGVSITATSMLQKKNQLFTEQYQAQKISRNGFEEYLTSTDELINMIDFNLQRASELIRSFKRVAVDQTSEETRTFFLSNYLEEIIISLKPKFKSTQHSIDIDAPTDLELTSYPGAFSQIITNLVFNSITHGFKDTELGEIAISAQQHDQSIVIRYQDNGCGISSDEIKKIYEPFYTTNRKQGNSGLGMHIVYNLVNQSLGGEIDCNSELGEGVRFTITLPIRHHLAD